MEKAIERLRSVPETQQDRLAQFVITSWKRMNDGPIPPPHMLTLYPG
jgi:hypothetical protein